MIKKCCKCGLDRVLDLFRKTKYRCKNVVRSALEDFIVKTNSSFCGLIGLRLFNLNDFYLEISPRGSGKTYRLVQHAINYLNEDSKNKVNLMGVERTCKRSKKLIGEYYKNRVFVNSKINGPELNIKNYYDEFDYNIELKEVDVNGYYTTTPSKVRNLQEIDELKKNDLLIKLIIHNKGKWINYMGFCGFYESNMLDFLKDCDCDQKHIEVEYLGKFLEWRKI